MRVMREGKTIDRAVWLAKRGGPCKEPDRLRSECLSLNFVSFYLIYFCPKIRVLYSHSPEPFFEAELSRAMLLLCCKGHETTYCPRLI